MDDKLKTLCEAVHTHINALAESDHRKDWHESGIDLEVALGEYEATNENTSDNSLKPALAEAPGSAQSIESLEAENKRLREIVMRCNSDWQALRDWIVATNGPTEACRFWDAAKTNKGVGIFRSYLVSLWAELDKAKAPNDQAEPRGPAI